MRKTTTITNVFITDLEIQLYTPDPEHLASYTLEDREDVWIVYGTVDSKHIRKRVMVGLADSYDEAKKIVEQIVMIQSDDWSKHIFKVWEEDKAVQFEDYKGWR